MSAANAITIVKFVKIDCENSAPFKYQEVGKTHDQYELNPDDLSADRTYVCMFLIPSKITAVMNKVMAHFKNHVFPPQTKLNDQYQSACYCLKCKSQNPQFADDNFIPVVIHSFPRHPVLEQLLKILGKGLGQPLSHRSQAAIIPLSSRTIQILLPKSDKVLVFSDDTKEPEMTIMVAATDKNDNKDEIKSKS
jgi:hypothetical protein